MKKLIYLSGLIAIFIDATQNVVIETSSLHAKLHVADSAILFSA